MVGVLVRVEHGVHQADLLAQQLLAQVGRRVDQQIAVGQAQDRAAARAAFRGFALRQTSQPQPITGTPTLVPVPSRIIWPRMSVVIELAGHKQFVDAAGWKSES